MTTVAGYIQSRNLSWFTEPVLSTMVHVRPLIESVPISYKLKALTKNGVYYSQRGPIGTIALNRHLSPEDADKTFLHELAHAIEKLAYGSLGHGPRWRRIMIAMQQPAERTSSRPSLKTYRDSVPMRWNYVCRDCGWSCKTLRRLKNAAFRHHTPCKFKTYRGLLNEIPLT